MQPDPEPPRAQSADPVPHEAGAPLPHTVDVAVIGAGIAGLVAARDCARIGAQVIVFEESDVTGDHIDRETVAGIQLDTVAGFNLGDGAVAALLGELDLADLLVAPRSLGQWLHVDGHTLPQPAGLLLGIPSSPLATDVVHVLGTRGALRAYLDRVRPVLTIGREQNLGALVRKRMGARALARLVAPEILSRYGADPDEVDVDIVAPELNAAMTRQGSLSGAVSELLGAMPNGGTIGGIRGGIRGGMSQLIGALIDKIRFVGARVETGCEVTGVFATPAASPETDETKGQTGARWQVELADGRQIAARSVIVAGGQGLSLRMLASVAQAVPAPGTGTGSAPGTATGTATASGTAPEGAAVEGPSWPTRRAATVVTLVVDAPELDEAPRASGVLVAQPAAGICAVQLTHLTAKWDWLANEIRSDVHPSRHVLRLKYGGHEHDVASGSSETSDRSKDALVAMALADASALLGISLEQSALVDAACSCRHGEVSSALIGHKDRIDSLRKTIAELEGFELVGAWLAGADLTSVIADARAAAGRIRAQLLQDGFHIGRWTT